MLPNLYPLKGLQGRVDTEISAKPLEQFSINPMIIRSELSGDIYSFYFNNMIYNGQPMRGVPKVNQDILRAKLNTWLKPSDRKYIKLVDYNNTKSKFSFDIDSWLEDGLKNCKPYDNYMILSRSYKLSKPLPNMIACYGMEMVYGKYISDRFKKYISQSSGRSKDLLSIIEKFTGKNKGNIQMFEYRYDRVSNSVIATIKPIYVAMLVATATALAKDESWKKKVNFDKTVGMFLNLK